MSISICISGTLSVSGDSRRSTPARASPLTGARAYFAPKRWKLVRPREPSAPSCVSQRRQRAAMRRKGGAEPAERRAHALQRRRPRPPEHAQARALLPLTGCSGESSRCQHGAVSMKYPRLVRAAGVARSHPQPASWPESAPETPTRAPPRSRRTCGGTREVSARRPAHHQPTAGHTLPERPPAALHQTPHDAHLSHVHESPTYAAITPPPQCGAIATAKRPRSLSR